VTCDRKIGPFDCCSVVEGDCLELMRELPDGCVDAVVTDPPYGIKRFEKGFGYTRFKGHGAETEGLAWDKKPTEEMWREIFRVAPVRVIWGANNFDLPTSQTFLVWDKYQTGENFASAELAYCDLPSSTAKVFRYSIHQHNQTEKFHPTQKPDSLMEWCLVQAGSPASVLDPFAGSGTTLVACKRQGVHFLGMEISPDYCAIARDRLARIDAQPNLFQPKPEQMSL
jgi:site-specific DNA-methyltransferase (adenine-specific)